MYNGFYGGNPFLNSSYLPDQQYYQPQQSRRSYEEQMAQAARARALADQRARRAQWLPDEDDDYEDPDDWEYSQLGPRERVYLEARKRQQQLERQERMRQEQELARQKALEDLRWQQQLERREREENEKKLRVLEEQRRLQQVRRAQLAKLQAEREKENARREASRSPSRGRQDGAPKKQPSPSPAPQNREPTPKPQYDEKHEEAASTIQHHYRIHQSLKAIRDLENKFNDLKNGFTYPQAIEFLQPGAPNIHIHVEAQRPPPPEGEEIASMESDGKHEAKLAYSSRNYALHAYVEALSKLLMQLDGVDSWGSSDVRNRRKGVVRLIEQEAQRVEVYWKNAWQDYADSRKEENQVEEAVQTEDDMS